MHDRGSFVVKANPWPILLSASEAAARSQSSQQVQGGECTTIADHNSGAEHDESCGRRCQPGCLFPRVHDVAQKTSALARLVSEHLTGTAAEVANRRATEKDCRRCRSSPNRLCQGASTLDARSQDFTLIAGRPGDFSCARACEIDDGIRFFDGSIIDGSSVWIPPILACSLRLAAYEPQHLKAGGFQLGNEFGADIAGCARDEDARDGGRRRSVTHS